MLRLVILALGLAIGYAYGYRDAHRHDKPIPSRLMALLSDGVRAFAGSDAGGRGRVTPAR